MCLTLLVGCNSNTSSDDTTYEDTQATDYDTSDEDYTYNENITDETEEESYYEN